MRNIAGRFTEEIVKRINAYVKRGKRLTRSKLSRKVCEWLQWKGINGEAKEVSCRIALLKLHRKGIIDLPAANPVSFKRKRDEEEKIFWTEINSTLEEMGRIELVVIETGDKALSRLWNRMMEEHHYLGRGPLCGKQVRYLIRGCNSWLGGLSFSSAAWRLRSRDEWIGWDERGRQENLHKVVCNSRFLILRGVRIRNLASRMLGLSAKRLKEDWQKRYGYSPVLLESFVEDGRFIGTSYRAANWQHIGRTAGRGRQDRKHDVAVPVKSVYVLPLEKDYQRELCGAGWIHGNGSERKRVEDRDWAEEEFADARLGDERLKKRLITLAGDFYSQPEAHIPEACGSKAKTKAAYRFFENPGVKMTEVLQAHYETTQKRLKEHETVLAVQDTTTLNYSAHPATDGLGFIGSKKEGGPIGLIVHNTMAYSLQGTPLGLLDVQCWARDTEDWGKKRRRHNTPIEQKESNKWLKSIIAVKEAAKADIGVKIVSVADREADIYELFALVRGLKGIELLIRAESNRRLKGEQSRLWEHMAKQPCEGIQEIALPRRGIKAARTAKLEVRYSAVTLIHPDGKTDMENIDMHAVWVREKEAPDGVTPLEWKMLTTMEVKGFDDACEKVRWYMLRWGIEVYHRTLKSGCKIEDRQLGSAEGIEKCLAIDSVVAWRICYLTKLGRETPHAPCTVYFQEAEWKALTAYITHNPVPPQQPPTLAEAIRMVASIGGFIGRKRDGEPGTQTIWRGLQRLDDITEMWKIMMNTINRMQKELCVSSRDYG